MYAGIIQRGIIEKINLNDMSENKINTGAIFKNEKKSAQSHPDYRGVVNANGKEMEIALWLRESKSGVKYFSVMMTEPFVKDNAPADDHAPEPLTPQEDDLPF
ncbi:MAG: DUF736 domain-containing protein [Ignavibacteria bacterium]|nr:DUF736 domain-containing protein [Ignavibacteria bacterium]